MLNVMAQIARGDADNANNSTTVTMNRVELYRVFLQISQQIGEALDELRDENWFGNQHRTWQ
ncbi:hypothetical protein DWU98_11010 [Dyella monticola]|uniref:Uncharacterized protein n=2 Tax=Dyella monticola TaxID=1927958 RepID=A0A370X017_9GAMM|nr:hypothetical protein DWU98_11010 [Dyella monticola]